MDMTLNQRLDKFLYEKNFTQEQLRIKLGLKNRQQVSNWINCHDHIPDKHLIAIIKLFPELNANWLLRGVGSMIIDQQQLRQINRNEFGFCENCVDKDKEISMLKELLEKKENELRQLYRESGKLEERLYQYEKRKVKLENISAKKTVDLIMRSTVFYIIRFILLPCSSA